MQRSFLRRCVQAAPSPVEVARIAISQGSLDEALRTLDGLKARGRTTADRDCDLLRAQAFLAKGDIFAARQALLEELRYAPDNEMAAQLMNTFREHFEEQLALPREIVKQEPLFAMCYEGLLESTMLTWPRLLSIFRAARALAEDGVEGDFVECGVAGGGSAVLAALAFAHYDKPQVRRRFFACDTFSGMPPPAAADKLATSGSLAESTHWGTGTCAGPVNQVVALATRFGVELQPVVGLFDTTLPKLDVSRVALFHCDCDWYESTRSALHHIVPKMNVRGGVIQVDDYHYWAGCKKAVNEYFESCPPKWTEIDGNAVLTKLKQ